MTPLHSGSPTYDGEIVISSDFTSLIQAAVMDGGAGPQGKQIASPRATSFRKVPKAWRTPWRIGSSEIEDPDAFERHLHQRPPRRPGRGRCN